MRRPIGWFGCWEDLWYIKNGKLTAVFTLKAFGHTATVKI